MSNTSSASIRATINDYMKQGQLELAQDHCLEALRDHPDDAFLLMYLAQIDEQKGDTENALKGLERAVQSGPNEPAPYVELARLLANTGRLDEAIESLQACVRIAPNHAGAWALLGRCQFRAGQNEAARNAWLSARRIDPGHAPSLTGLSELSLRDNDLNQAHAYASQAVNSAPQDAPAQIQMARVFALQGQRDFAERCMDNAIELLPDSHEIIVARAGLLALEGRHADVLDLIEQARERGLTHSKLQLQKARSTLPVKGLVEAGKIYEDLIQTSPEAESILLEIAGIYLTQGEFQAFTTLLDEHAEKLQAHQLVWLRARHAQLVGDQSKSLELVHQLIDCNDAELRILSRLHLAQAEINKPETDQQKVAAYLESLLDEPQLGVVGAWQIARLSELNGEDERIIRILTPLLDRDGLSESQLRQTRALLAQAMDRGGRYSEAGELLRQAAWRGEYIDQDVRAGDFSQYSTNTSADPVDDADRVIFLHALPGMGLDVLLPALSDHPDLVVQDPGSGADRLQNLFPPPESGSVNEQYRWSVIRRRYLRPLRDFSHLKMMESIPLKLAHLPRIAALFPQATIIAPQINPDMMRLHWQFMGYSNVQTMIELWQAHEENLRNLSDVLPLNLIVYDLARLVDHPEQEMTNLLNQLGLDGQKISSKRLREGLKQNHYRPSSHWQHYAPEANH